MMALDGEPGWMCLMSCNIDRKSCYLPITEKHYIHLARPHTNNPLLTVLFDAVIVQYVTSRDNRGTTTTRSYDNKGGNNTAVTVERSVAIKHSAHRGAGGRLGRSGGKGNSVIETEEEIGMSELGAAPAGTTYHLSSENNNHNKGDLDFSSERSASSVNDMEMGNSTNVVVITKDSY